jgi:hypothetical protein
MVFVTLSFLRCRRNCSRSRSSLAILLSTTFLYCRHRPKWSAALVYQNLSEAARRRPDWQQQSWKF